jgi:DNA-binding MarR family transcriptional regulator
MKLFQQLNPPANNLQRPPAPQEKPRHSNKRSVADALWAKAFDGKILTSPELAQIRGHAPSRVSTTMRELEERGVVEYVGGKEIARGRYIPLWRWVGETEE